MITFHWIYLLVGALIAVAVTLCNRSMAREQPFGASLVFVIAVNLGIVALGIVAMYATQYLIGRYGW